MPRGFLSWPTGWRPYFSNAEEWEHFESDDKLDAGFVELVDSMFVEGVPVARRLMQLLEERGWSGWTQVEPTPADAGR